jgi:hypothetical protein
VRFTSKPRCQSSGPGAAVGIVGDGVLKKGEQVPLVVGYSSRIAHASWNSASVRCYSRSASIHLGPSVSTIFSPCIRWNGAFLPAVRSRVRIDNQPTRAMWHSLLWRLNWSRLQLGQEICDELNQR